MGNIPQFCRCRDQIVSPAPPHSSTHNPTVINASSKAIILFQIAEAAEIYLLR